MRLKKNQLILVYGAFFFLATFLLVYLFHFYLFQIGWMWEFILATNIGSFLLIGLDKSMASFGSQPVAVSSNRERRERGYSNAPRLPEGFFYLVALLGGSIGILVGLNIFRHKTRKFSFLWRILAIILLQVGLIGYIIST